MNIDFNNLDVKLKINQLAEICYYGIEWNRDIADSDSYILGGIETTAHIISCCIVQWFGIESCGTGETRDALFMQNAVKVTTQYKFSIEKWERLIEQFLRAEIYRENP